MISRVIDWLVRKSPAYGRLNAELRASVDYHANYRAKVDAALGQPRTGGSILDSHLAEIRRLKGET